MTDDKPVRGVPITGFTPAFCQHVFFLPAQHREPLDFLKIMIDAGFGRKNRPGDGRGTCSAPSH